MQAPSYPQPQQGDSLGNLDKLIDIADKLAERRSGGNLQPGTSQYSPMNAGQFQSADMQQLALQELLLRNPQLLTQLQGQQQTQQQSAIPEGSKVFSPQQVEALKTQIGTIIDCANSHQKQLIQLWEFTQKIMQVFNAFAQYTGELEKVAILGSQYKNLSNAFLNELNAIYNIADIQYAMLNTPQFALMHTSNLIKYHIDGTDDAAMDLISEEYVDVVRNFEEKKKKVTGKYSDTYTDYLQQVVTPTAHSNYKTTPQIQNKSEIDSVIAWANGLKSQGFGTQIKRAHTQQLLRR